MVSDPVQAMPSSSVEMSLMRSVVLWDFDGVLADTLEECYEVTRRTVEKEKEKLKAAVHGEEKENSENAALLPYPFEEFAHDRPFCVNAADFFCSYIARRKFGETTEKNMHEIHRRERPLIAGLDAEYYVQRGLLAKEMGKKYHEWLAPYEGVLETVKQLKRRGAKQAVMTARDSQSVREWARHHKVEEVFQSFVGTEVSRADRMVKQKQIHVLKERLGAGQYYFVDDIAHNLEVVHAVDPRIVPLFAAWGYGKRAPKIAKTVQSPAELLSRF